MEEKYKPIRPEDVFITAFKRQPTEEELWHDITLKSNGNRPSGNNFIDLFAHLIYTHGRKDIRDYARMMDVSADDLYRTIRVLGGMSAPEWRNRYLLLEAQELLTKSKMEISAISKILGFSQPSVFSHFFHSLTGKQPFEWRNKRPRIKP